MADNSDSKDVLIPRQPMPDGQPTDEAAVAKDLSGMDDVLDIIAVGLYNMASMLVGEGEDSIRLVETAVAQAEIPASGNGRQAPISSRRALCTAAVELIAERNPGSLAAPEWLEHAATCIEDDDLESAGISRAELESMLAGPNRRNVRNWIESLAIQTRVIFVLRAVAGFTADETATILSEHGGKCAKGWNADAVREIFRQGLCSLASQLIHATAR